MCDIGLEVGGASWITHQLKEISEEAGASIATSEAFVGFGVDEANFIIGVRGGGWVDERVGGDEGAIDGEWGVGGDERGLPGGGVGCRHAR